MNKTQLLCIHSGTLRHKFLLFGDKLGTSRYKTEVLRIYAVTSWHKFQIFGAVTNKVLLGVKHKSFGHFRSLLGINTSI